MAQHDYVIDNQGASPARADLNNVFQAIMSMNSGATAPSTTVANMFWYDTANDLLKMRNETNTGWITLGTVDQTNNVFNPNFLPATQAEAEAGTDNVKGMTPLRVKQAIAVLSPYPYKNATLFTSSGSWTVPTGVTKAFVLVVGGGGGGAGNNSTSTPNGDGGVGGAGYATLTGLSGTITVTIGAGGAGTNSTANGSAGGSSTFSTVTATGGGGGITSGADGGNGTATGADFTTVAFGYLNYMFGYAIPNSTCFSIMKDYNSTRFGAASSTAALAYTAGNAGLLSAGAGGSGESGNTSNATGGVGGAVLIFY